MVTQELDFIKIAAQAIKNKREKKGWSQEQLAVKVFGEGKEAKRKTISDIETGRTNSSLRQISEICKALKMGMKFYDFKS